MEDKNLKKILEELDKDNKNKDSKIYKETLKCFINLIDNEGRTPSHEKIAKALNVKTPTIRKRFEKINHKLGLTSEKYGRDNRSPYLGDLYFYNQETFDQFLFPERSSEQQINSNLYLNSKNRTTSNIKPYQDFAVYEKNYWVGREAEIKKVKYSISDSYRIDLILGITGIGKTALAEKIVAELNIESSDLLRKNFDFTQMKSEKNFIETARQWLAQLGEFEILQERDSENILSYLVKKLCQNRYIVLIDSLEHILTGNEDKGWEDFIDQLWYKFFRKILYAETCQSNLILTSQDFALSLQELYSERQNYFSYQVLNGLKDTEQLNLFEKYQLNINDSTKKLIVRIGKVYMGHPLALKVIASTIKHDFNNSIIEYWEAYGSDIKNIEKILEEDNKKNIENIDNWKIDRYNKRLKHLVSKRFKGAFERLKQQYYISYELICRVSVYPRPLSKNALFEQLSDDYDEQQFEQALEVLRDRALIEVKLDPSTEKRVFNLHNLIRSQALQCLESL